MKAVKNKSSDKKSVKRKKNKTDENIEEESLSEKEHNLKIMRESTNQELLNRRKEEAKIIEQNRKLELLKKHTEIIVKEKEWWQLPISKKDFVIKELDSKFYAHNKNWNEYTWIGPYVTKKEVNDIIKYYVENDTDNLSKNVHSILIDFDKKEILT